MVRICFKLRFEPQAFGGERGNAILHLFELLAQPAHWVTARRFSPSG